MYAYGLDGFECNDGTAVDLGDFLAIIGPNNSGKSRALRDLASLTTDRATHPNTKIVNSVRPRLPADVLELYETYPHLRGKVVQTGVVTSALSPSLDDAQNVQWGGSVESIESNLNNALKNKDIASTSSFIGARLTTHLKTESRLSILNSGPNLQNEDAMTLLQQLYLRGPEMELEVRRIIKDVFDVEIVLDYTIPSQLCLRVANVLGEIPADPRSARPILEQFEKLDVQGDGLRSFVGVVAALLVMKRPVCMIDEPEAFLHPPQAYALGRFLANMSGPNQQIIIATHSSDILRGILSVKGDVSVLRIDRLGDTNRFRQLARERLSEITKDPLLASHRVMDGLFSSAAIVVEADADARFYELIFNKVRVNSDIHFVSADNKQTVPRIATLYRELGVRTVGIVDIDVLNNADEFGRQISALNLNHDEVRVLTEAQSVLAKSVSGKSSKERAGELLSRLSVVKSEIEGIALDASDSVIDKILKGADSSIKKTIENGRPWSEIKERGADAFSQGGKEAFESVFRICSKAGLFINRYGELESMLTDVGLPYTSDKRSWIQSAILLASSLQYSEGKRAFSFMKAVDTNLFEGKE